MIVVVGLEGVTAGRVGIRPSLHRRGSWCQFRSSALGDASSEVVGAEAGGTGVGIVLDGSLRHMGHGTVFDPGMLSRGWDSRSLGGCRWLRWLRWTRLAMGYCLGVTFCWLGV